ncbi:MAG: glycosyltransferase [Candidatus Babeliaceae bacterium]|nr:glycosyltransferase [Candidatus Babeliaceae bacterium]
MRKSIWYVGGKSAGHIMPLITLAEQNTSESVFITTHRKLDKKIISAHTPQSTHCALYVPDINRRKFWLLPLHALIWLAAYAKLIFLFFKTRPEKVISTGGLSAVPVFLFARLLRIPCELFELNAVPGNAVKFLAPLSSKIYYCYRSALAHLNYKHLYYKPYPVREFNAVTTYEARTHLKLDPEKKTICFLGGSQGSQFINDFALALISRFSPSQIQVVHQAGSVGVARLTSWYADQKYSAYVVDYFEEIELFYCAADAVVCRAGAGTLWELEYMNIPTCIIPLETSMTDHQLYNAQALCKQKPQQFFMVRQSQAETAIDKIMSFFKHNKNKDACS